MLHIEPSPGCRVGSLCGVDTPPGAVVLASTREVQTAIQTLAEVIQPWIDAQPQEPVVLVALLHGGKFYADRLSSELGTRCSANFTRFDVKISTRDEAGRLLDDPRIDGAIETLSGRRVLVVDDILDSGLTLRLITAAFAPIAAELKSTVLIQKDPPDQSGEDRPSADYVGLRFTDSRWYSGAGMDMPNDPAGKSRESSMIIAYPPPV